MAGKGRSKVKRRRTGKSTGKSAGRSNAKGKGRNPARGKAKAGGGGKGRQRRPQAEAGKGTARARSRRHANAPFPLPDGWTLDRGGRSISYRVVTQDFLEAVALINAIAPVAEELEHHPDFHLEEWNKLRITTWSHDAGRLTKRDERLARRISALMERLWKARR